MRVGLKAPSGPEKTRRLLNRLDALVRQIAGGFFNHVFGHLVSGRIDRICGLFDVGLLD